MFEAKLLAIVKMLLQNVTLPNLCGFAFVLLNIIGGFGKGLGPVLVLIENSGRVLHVSMTAFIVIFGGKWAVFYVGVAGWISCDMLI